jgi:hypothetical protein
MKTRAGVVGVVGVLLSLTMVGPTSAAKSTKAKKRKPTASANPPAPSSKPGTIARISPTPFVPGPPAPSGTKITFEKDNTKTVNVPGSAPRPIERAINAHFLPNNGGIVYAQHDQQSTSVSYNAETPVIRLQSIDGSNDVPIVLGTQPAVSYDERMLTFVSYRPREQLEGIGVVDLQTGAGKLIVNNAQIANGRFTNAKPQWSPDGRWISFGAETKGGPVSIWIVGADGSGLRKLWDSPVAADGPSVNWIVDGQSVEVYYTSKEPFEIQKVLLYLDGRVEQRKNGEIINYKTISPRQSVP